jgi:hypothetical protein
VVVVPLMPGDNRFGAGEVIEVANYTVKFLRIRCVKFQFLKRLMLDRRP